MSVEMLIIFGLCTADMQLAVVGGGGGGGRERLAASIVHRTDKGKLNNRRRRPRCCRAFDSLISLVKVGR